jgi:hypothetical protein
MFVQLQDRMIMIHQQRAIIESLIFRISAMFELTNSGTLKNLNCDEWFLEGQFSVRYNVVVDYINDQGLAVRDMLLSLDFTSKISILQDISRVVIGIISGLSKIQAESD